MHTRLGKDKYGFETLHESQDVPSEHLAHVGRHRLLHPPPPGVKY